MCTWVFVRAFRSWQQYWKWGGRDQARSDEEEFWREGDGVERRKRLALESWEWRMDGRSGCDESGLIGMTRGVYFLPFQERER